MADRETVGEWETLQIERCDDQDNENNTTGNGVGIVSWEGKYLSCNLSGKLEWNREECEKVRIELTRRGFVIKSCCHGNYLCAKEDGTVKCNREAAGRWESFEGGTFPVTRDIGELSRTEAGPWEMFECDLKDGKATFKTWLW